MNTTYRTLTLEGLIRALDNLPAGATVQGLGTEIKSYRGYYERNALSATEEQIPAQTLSGALSDQIGKPIFGYKGGDYFVSPQENVYLASYGDTGPNICGLIASDGGIFRPLLVEVNEW